MVAAKLHRPVVAVTTRTEAMKLFVLARVAIDTTVQLKAMTFLTDAEFINSDREQLVQLANQGGAELRKSNRGDRCASCSVNT